LLLSAVSREGIETTLRELARIIDQSRAEEADLEAAKADGKAKSDFRDK
jgi:GTP-binding protein